MNGTDTKTERYMIIFNNVGLTIKGYYNELITPIQRRRILDRLYSLIHPELFEGAKPLEAEPILQPVPSSVAPLPDTEPDTEPASQQELKDKPWKKYYKYKKTGKKKGRPRKKGISEIDDESFGMPVIADNAPPAKEEPKDLVYDNEENDNQYDEFKKKGLI